MKWVALIVVLFLGGGFLWWYHYGGTGAWQGTPTGAAKDFVHAAAEGDTRLAASYCEPQIEQQAVAVALRLAAESFDPRGVVFKEVTTEADTLTALVNGKILTVRVRERAQDDWVIVAIDF